MAFTNRELEQIYRMVGSLCEQRVPDHVKHEIRLSYSIANHEVVICEERPLLDQPSEWIALEIAKLRYVRKSDEWQLYWKRASGKWWPYEPLTRSKTLAAMIKEIDLDSDGCFFG
ncbi:MAG TPA: hypothetical protein DC047_11620 [Blastocatellia bacterium]|nr:hypothetical protein [Blastocatellia bacterium]